jgi:hypothetical protein
MKRTSTKRHQAEICRAEFHPNRSWNMEVTARNSFTPVSKARLPPHRFSSNSRQLDNFFHGTLIPNFMKIQQTVLSLMPGPWHNMRTRPTNTECFFFFTSYRTHEKQRAEEISCMCYIRWIESVTSHTLFLRSILISNYLNLGLPNHLFPSDFPTATF